MITYYPSKTVDFSGKSGIIKVQGGVKTMYSGGILESGALNPNKEDDFERAEKHAFKYYEEIRKRESDIKAISDNVNWNENEIANIKQHLFLNKYDLGGEEPEYFYPNYDIAVSWQNLIEGKNIEEKDIVLLKHEQYEYNLMKEKNITYEEAHKITEEKYNYAKAVDDWRKSNE